MGQDTLSQKNKLGELREAAKSWLIKLRLIVPEEDEPEQISRQSRQTYIPPRAGNIPPRASAPQTRRPTAQTAMRTGARSAGTGIPERKVDTAVFFVDSLSSCTYAIKAVIEGISVIVHFVNTDRSTAQRIIDTLSGAAFALNAKIKKVEDNTYLIAPRGMNINVVHPSERRY